jgi:hypothetical protein
MNNGVSNTIDKMRGQRRVMSAVAGFLGFVTVAPLIISGQDLYHWAESTNGLNLPAGFALLIPVVFDIAAASCIGMNIIGAVWRSERTGIFGLMTWVFAGASAFAQYRSGMSSLRDGVALDAYWAFPLIAILGPTLLHLVLNKIRKWTKEDAGVIKRGAAGFGTRWIPGVAFRETLRAWAVSHREGILQWEAAVTLVREQGALRELATCEGGWFSHKRYIANNSVFAYAADALPESDAYTIRKWLSARGILVTGLVSRPSLEQAVEIPELIVADESPVAVEELENSAPIVVDVAMVERAKPSRQRPASIDLEKIDETLPGWRKEIPSARAIADRLGYKSPSSGNKVRKMLVAIVEENVSEDD